MSDMTDNERFIKFIEDHVYAILKDMNGKQRFELYSISSLKEEVKKLVGEDSDIYKEIEGLVEVTINESNVSDFTAHMEEFYNNYKIIINILDKVTADKDNLLMLIHVLTQSLVSEYYKYAACLKDKQDRSEIARG